MTDQSVGFFQISISRKRRTWLHFLIFSIFVSLVASEDEIPANFTKPYKLSTPATDITGRLCMTVEHFKSGMDSSAFYECSPLSDQEVKEYKLADKYLGIWTKRDCPENFEFDETKQRCIENRKLRRQQAACGTNPGSQGCMAPCQATNENPNIGAPCNWLTAKLMPDSLSSSYFLQCTIQNPGETCGEWVRMPCTPGTEFNFQAQVCVPSGYVKSNPCGPAAIPITPCGQETSCPGQSACQNSVCCEAVSIDVNMAIQPQQSPAVLCYGSNTPPISSCYPSCPPSYECQDSIGCCPVTLSSSLIAPQSISMNLCPDYIPSVGSCNSCPSGYSCNQNTGGCCRQSSDSSYTAIVLCPSGTPALGACGRLNQCPDGQGCYKGVCCPMVCPKGLQAQGWCSSNSCSSGSCQNGCCCSESPKLPICANGKTAVTICIRDEECGPGMECSNGGCCSVSYCPSGIQSIGRCANSASCGTSGVVCLHGLCCPLPPCSGGGIALGVCNVNSNCGPGFECQNFGCCPLPQCPTGNVAIKRCGKGCNNCCPSGASCVNDLCCELPRCATGAVAIGFCNKKNTCSSGSQCVSGACCPLPRCPSGSIGSQFCQFGSACPGGQICANGVCCNLPTCSYTGQIAMSVCGVGNACPMGYICEGRGCCPEPMPLCPNGGRATQKCLRGVDCPPGYGCTPMGGCCLLSLEPACPRNMNPICQCSSNRCPNDASCNMGTCCTSSMATYNVIPGSRCQYTTQCNGYSQSYSSCVKNTCTCVKGSYSNGVSCNSPNVIVLNKARNGCDQYGSPCKYVFSTARRKPIFAPVNNATETPLWFSVHAERNCVMNDSSVDFDPDSTCLPSEKCIDGKCKLKLWPGEYGCTVDLECSSRCANTYCEAKSDKNVPQCQCKNGLLLYSRCFEKCPNGFHESGAYCMHDDDDAFWADADAQENLQKLLNEGEC